MQGNDARQIAALACSSAAQQPGIVLLRSANAEGNVDISRTEIMLRSLVFDLGLSGKPLPAILLIHVSRREAALAKVDEAAPAMGALPLTPAGVPVARHSAVYQLWVIGVPSDPKLIEMLFSVLLDDSRLPMSQADAQPILRRALARADSTIDVKAFAARQKGRKK